MTYIYDCPRCGVFEAQQRITEPRLSQCPRCGRSEPKRLISAAPEFSLREGAAGGWSSTGYGHTNAQLNAMRKLGKRLTPRG